VKLENLETFGQKKVFHNFLQFGFLEAKKKYFGSFVEDIVIVTKASFQTSQVIN